MVRESGRGWEGEIETCAVFSTVIILANRCGFNAEVNGGLMNGNNRKVDKLLTSRCPELLNIFLVFLILPFSHMTQQKSVCVCVVKTC